jgi:hypothetical protein
MKGGEKVKKIAIMIVAVLSLLMVFAVVSPALACPIQKIDFTVKSAPLSVTVVDTFTTPNGIVHTTVSFTGILFGATGTEASIFSGATVSGTNVEVVSSITAQGKVMVHWTWHLAGGSFEGGFAGDVDGVGPTAALVNLHGVMLGTGDYKGWIISVEGNKPAGANPFSWTGTIVIL